MALQYGCNGDGYGDDTGDPRYADLLAEQARVRGMSLAALLAEIAREQEIEEAFESERQARSRRS